MLEFGPAIVGFDVGDRNIHPQKGCGAARAGDRTNAEAIQCVRIDFGKTGASQRVEQAGCIDGQNRTGHARKQRLDLFAEAPAGRYQRNPGGDHLKNRILQLEQNARGGVHIRRSWGIRIRFHRAVI